MSKVKVYEKPDPRYQSKRSVLKLISYVFVGISGISIGLVINLATFFDVHSITNAKSTTAKTTAEVPTNSNGSPTAFDQIAFELVPLPNTPTLATTPDSMDTVTSRGRGDRKRYITERRERKRDKLKGRSWNEPPKVYVIHVGPPKTGSTSIQHTLTDTKCNSTLDFDNYRYFKELFDPRNPQHQALNVNNTANIIVVKEGLANGNVSEAIMEAINSQWDVRVVVTYRRLHEILPSTYYQRYKRFPKNPKKVKGSIVKGWNQKLGHEHWPGIENDFRIPSFAEYLTDHYSFMTSLWKGPSPIDGTVDYTSPVWLDVYQKWNEIVPNKVSFFHFHQEGDPTTNFVCQAIPGANRTCDYLSSLTPILGNPTNVGFLDSDILAVAAYEQGLVHKSDNRISLQLAIYNIAQEDQQSNRLPLICPDQEIIDKIYSASKHHESLMLPWASKPVTDFEASWNKALREQKFCSLDAPKALEQNFWKDFFLERYENITAGVSRNETNAQ